jgi:uncharacterized protein (TIRG00374 family)
MRDPARASGAGDDEPSASMEEMADVAVDSGSPARGRRRLFTTFLKLMAAVGVLWFFVLPLIPGLRKATSQLQQVDPALLVIGVGLEFSALMAYSMLTKVALGPSSHYVSAFRMFRIQMSTRALSSVVPGGSAAGSALGFRLITLSGVAGPDAGFALGTAGMASAVVLNLILWIALIVSIPLRGVNPAYGLGAVVGIILMGLAAAIVFGLLEGQGRAEQAFRWLARRLRFDEERAGDAVRHVGARMEHLAADRRLLFKVVAWSAANWLLDAAALWVFLRAFGGSVALDGLLVAFGLANILAVIPITPGGLGIVEWIYIPTLIGFGLTRAEATLGVVTYRIAQFWLPIVVGAVMYLSLRVGPWSIERRDRLRPFRVLYEEARTSHESPLDFVERYGSGTTMVSPRLAPTLPPGAEHDDTLVDEPRPEIPGEPDDDQPEGTAG